jgi:hypothetical protein
MGLSYETGQIYMIPLQEGYVVEPPIWEDCFPVARNWLALIEENPSGPQGVTREFCDRGRGRFKYSAMLLVEGDTVEFGADKMLRRDQRVRLRWYGEIVKATMTDLHVRYFETIEEMFSTIRDRESRLVEAPKT